MSVGIHRQPLIAILSLSVLAGSTSTSIHHSHEFGLLPHAHGFGAMSVFPAAPPAAPSVDDLASRHSHFVILGFELYGGDEPLPQSPPQFPGSSDDPQVTLGVNDDVRPNDSARAAPAPLPSVGLSVPAAMRPLPYLAVPSPRTARCTLCDRSRGERSGVHLV
jgi:hypothetical protein